MKTWPFLLCFISPFRSQKVSGGKSPEQSYKFGSQDIAGNKRVKARDNYGSCRTWLGFILKGIVAVQQ
jgi:hypothetical protein